MNTIPNIKSLKISLTIILIKLLTATVAFASMGSTGGGGTSTDGGGSSNLSYSSNSSDSSSGSSSLLSYLIVGIFIFYSFSSYFIPLLMYSITFIVGFRDVITVNGLEYWMLSPNMTIDTFKKKLYQHNVKVKPNQKLDFQLAASLIETYGKAQFTYGQAIRRRFTHGTNYLGVLRQQLGAVFLTTMRAEIKRKAATGIIDDVIVNNGRVLAIRQISPNLIIAKIQVCGIDNEVNVFSHFNSSFSRQQWTDYVIFGRPQKTAEWKIYNIIYGEHFHLNGKDYNNQQGLDNADYHEQHLSISPELVKAAKNYHKNIKRHQQVIHYGLIAVVAFLAISYLTDTTFWGHFAYYFYKLFTF